MAAPHRVLQYQTEFIGQVPLLQPTNFQYKKPPSAPINVKIICSRLFLKKSFIVFILI